ncbi:MAG: thiamine pyrophosphate-dependent enzyme [Bacteroidales bacterium]|nr:thiamine pyrophosphate-dependent enzyme [Bacteroidales bacterium]
MRANKLNELKNTQEVEIVLNDFRIACESRQASLLGRKEVLTGKAKFGIFGDGKEVPQLALAKVFRKGDWRSGYYRDQTLMFATGMMSLEEFFAQLYGDTDLDFNPSTGGRLMNNHFATRTVNTDGTWKNHTELKNSSADISPTAGQMPRLLGLALASKIYRKNPALKDNTNFSINGNEVAFGTIGDASTSEGHFFETLNAAGVLQVPLAMSVWDDGWGISVSRRFQTTKDSISELLKGFEKESGKNGFLIYKVKGWDYEALCETYSKGIEICRREHIPVLFHVYELSQPQGHSTSGSHERYKDKDLLEWEKEHDCNLKFRQWILEKGLATDEELLKIETEAVERVKDARNKAWNNYQDPLIKEKNDFIELINIKNCNCRKSEKIEAIVNDLRKISNPVRKDIISNAKKILRLVCHSCVSDKSLKNTVRDWLKIAYENGRLRYNTYLYSENIMSALDISEVPPVYNEKSSFVNGREILLHNYDYIFAHNPEVLIFGEDVGRIGGVNQTLEGMQEKYGEVRISDTGIREASIVGQGIGLAMRGLRPIAEIQYFDYLLYALQTVSDDLATLCYRTVGGQKAPLIISTRGHRLEGVWHSGSPLSMIINAVRGILVLVPRNMTQAAGFYNTVLAADVPALIVEPLNAYRLKEKLPENVGQFRVPVGVPEIIENGSDVTIVTYGSCVRIAQDAVSQLREFDISCELIDVQSLLPFDKNASILKSLQKTNKLILFDEDVPGGATAFMMREILEVQGGFNFLDASPKTVTAKEHRPAYATDGDYFSNPNAEDLFEAVYEMMHEYNPVKYPEIF